MVEQNVYSYNNVFVYTNLGGNNIHISEYINVYRLQNISFPFL